MKKIVLLFSAVFLVAAGCNTRSVSLQSSQQTTGSSNAGLAASQAAASVKVNNVDDVVNVLEQSSASEQSTATSSNDSDLTNTDSTTLNNFTGVPNGN